MGNIIYVHLGEGFDDIYIIHKSNKYYINKDCKITEEDKLKLLAIYF